MKSKKYFVILIVVIAIIFSVFWLLKPKNLDVKSEKIQELYHYLGEVGTDHCGGLHVYDKDKTARNDISNEDKMCLAYYEIDRKEEGTLSVSGTNKYKTKICENDGLIFTTENESCAYTKVSRDDLNKMYQKIYGEEIPNEDSFYISNEKICYKKGENYLCGLGETFNFSFTAQSTIYRLLYKAIKTKDQIIITDYFLKVANDKCYATNESITEISECSKLLADSKIDEEFIKKYGTPYEHTYKLNDDGTYYWIQSNKKK